VGYRDGRQRVSVDAVSVDTTQWVGILGFGVAALLCARVARNGSPNWWILASLNALLIVEIVAGWRYRVHDLAGLYESRQPWQMAMIAVALVVLLIAGFAVRGRIHSAALASAVTGLCFAVSIFVIEAISLHTVDAVLYHFLGPFKVIAFLWLAASTWVGLAALIAAHR
jgi:hypothetical protein